MAEFDLVAIEQGIKDAIIALDRPYIAEVATYGGEFDDPESLGLAVRRFPAVWVTFSGAVPRPVSTSKKKWHIDLNFVVLVGARSIRNEESTRHGVVVSGQLVEVGTFQLLNDVRLALLGKTLGLQIVPFDMGRISTLFNTRIQNQAVSVLAQEYKTSLVVCVDDDADMPWMLSLGMDYHSPADSDEPVATEMINFEI